MELFSLRDFSIELVEELAQVCRNSTVQIYYLKNNEDIKTRGTGLLFEFEDNYFMITASHVIGDLNISELYVATSKFMKKIQREVYFTNPTQEEEKDPKDYLDLAVIKLDAILVSYLKEDFTFLKLADFGIHHKEKVLDISNISFLDNFYFVFGYPETRTELKYPTSNHWVSRPLYFTTYITENNRNFFQKKGYKYSYIVDFQKKMRNIKQGNHQILPRPEGMSGGGLWSIEGFTLNDGKPILKLVGILTDYKTGLKSVMIATKIEYVIEMIRQKFKLYRLPKTDANIEF